MCHHSLVETASYDLDNLINSVLKKISNVHLPHEAEVGPVLDEVSVGVDEVLLRGPAGSDA